METRGVDRAKEEEHIEPRGVKRSRRHQEEARGADEAKKNREEELKETYIHR